MTLIFLLFLQTDQRQMHFCVNLDPPIKQGQTRYHFLVFNFKVDEEEEIELPFTDEEVKEKFDGKLEREISGPTYEVKFMFFEKATKIEETFIVDLTLCSKCQIDSEDFFQNAVLC